MKELSDRVREEVYLQAGLKKKDKKTHNIHHIIFKSDLKKGLVDKHFPICDRSNLIPLDKETHATLHQIVETTPAYKDCIECRVWLANLAYNEDLDLI